MIQAGHWAGGQQGWCELILWICVSGWSERLRRVSRAGLWLDLGVSVASVVKWSQRFRSTGSAAAFKVGGRGLALAGERSWLLARIADEPDLTLRAVAAELAERGIRVSYFAVWHFFEHEGISFKKPARQRAGSARRAAAARTMEKYREGLIRRAWSSSMRPGPRPT